jgi:hypothetical protein
MRFNLRATTLSTSSAPAHSAPASPMSDFSHRLHATKQHYPFAHWVAAGEFLKQYSEANCAAVAGIFDALIEELAMLGEQASSEAKLEAFREAVEALNTLNAEAGGNLIETGEAEQLVALCNVIAAASGLEPAHYGGGEGVASEWREW